MAAVEVSAADKTIKVLWRGPAGAQGSPVVGGGAVWVTTTPTRGGTLYELNPATGAVEHQIAISARPAALLVAVAERRDRLRRHAERRHRDQRRLTQPAAVRPFARSTSPADQPAAWENRGGMRWNTPSFWVMLILIFDTEGNQLET